jgi:hypothetical protein
METQHVPSLQAVDAKGETYARIAPTFFPCETDGESRLVHHITSYTKQALWDAVQTWFGGGAEASGAINTEGAVLHQFTGKGGATWRIYPDGTPNEEKVPVAWSSFATPMAADANTFGYRWDPQFVKQTDSKQGPLVKLPEYFRLVKSGAKSQWVPVQAEEVPAETGLTQARFDRPERRPKAYVTPEDEASGWKKPGPQAGPFQAHPGDGSVVTYDWSPIFFDRNESPTRRTHARCPPRPAFPGLGRWQGCKALAEKVAKSSHQEDPIVRSLNALALLASGDSAYLPLVNPKKQLAPGACVKGARRPQARGSRLRAGPGL